MLTTCLGPNDLLVLAIGRCHSEVEVPVIRDHTRCSLTNQSSVLTVSANQRPALPDHWTPGADHSAAAAGTWCRWGQKGITFKPFNHVTFQRIYGSFWGAK